MMRIAPSILILLGLCFVPARVLAQVPVNDAERTVTETSTAVCMQRARTFKQATVSPTQGIHSSMTVGNDTGGMHATPSQSVFGQVLSGTAIGGSDFAILLAIANSVQAIRTKNVGEAASALAAVAAAISANSSSLSSQSGAVGTASSIKGAFEQNGIARLTNAQIWNQAIQAVSTTVQLRNQRLLDMTGTASATAKVGTYDPSKSALIGQAKQEGQ